MSHLSFAVTLGFAAVLALGCSTPLDMFVCASNSDCESAGQREATCEATKVCSYADSSCAEVGEGRRYGPVAGSHSNICVGEDDPEPSADASNIEVPDGGGETRPDANDGVDASTLDAATSCVDVQLTVFDDSAGNDKVRVKVNGVEVKTCQPESVPAPDDSLALCVVCVPLGAQIELKSEDVGRLTQFTTTCSSDCGLQEKCAFTASSQCTVLAVFDAANPP